jgi:hypothetical protein
LASGQDRDNWFDLVDTRREEEAEPVIVRPFVDYMISLGILSPAKEKKGYSIQWPDRDAGDLDRAKVGDVIMGALGKYLSQPGAESLVPPGWTLRKLLGITDEDNDLIEKELEAHLKEQGIEEEPEPALEPSTGNPGGDEGTPESGKGVPNSDGRGGPATTQ